MSIGTLVQSYRLGKDFTHIERQVFDRLYGPIWDDQEYINDIYRMSLQRNRYKQCEDIITENGSLCVKAAFSLGRYTDLPTKIRTQYEISKLNQKSV